MDKINLTGLTPDDIIGLSGIGDLKLFQAVRITNHIYKKRISDLSNIDKIQLKVLDELRMKFHADLFLPVMKDKSSDGSIKYLFKTSDGRKFETVFIPDEKRNTLCISSQAGCRMGCPFCATGRSGFQGDLSAGEILNQFLSNPDAGKISHIVFMGMGEPMDNLDNVLQACNVLTAQWGCAISPRNITVSSVGITPGIERFLAESRCNLSVSLFSPFYYERRKILPVENKYPVKDIIRVLRNYPLTKNRRITIAYMMIDNVNDSDAHLSELKNILKGSEIRINLLPYHSTGDDHYLPSKYERMMFFKHELVISGISASIRKSRGADISAACGLLASGN